MGGTIYGRPDLDRSPVATIQNIRITKQSTASLTHGSFTGAADPLPEGSVLEIVSVTQGGVAYTGGTDYKLSAGKVDWSLPGIEPATGSTYQVVFKHIKAVQPEAQDETGVMVSNAVPGTLIQISYAAKLPRIDRLALNEQGEFIWFNGIPADFSPRPPDISGTLLPIASVQQMWTTERRVINDGVRVVPMSDIAAINERMDTGPDVPAGSLKTWPSSGLLLTSTCGLQDP